MSLLFPKRRQSRLLVGHNAINGRPVYVPRETAEDVLRNHWQVLGTTGFGKTKFLEHLCRWFIDQNKGFCLLDPDGTLYRNVLRYVVWKGRERNLILIDPTDNEWATGLNYLERGRWMALDLDAQIDMVMEMIGKVFGGENEEVKPRLERWERNTLHALAECGYTLIEMLDFLSIGDPKPRREIVELLNNPYVKKEWEEYEKRSLPMKEGLTESVFNRAARFINSDRIRRIVGQQKTTVDFRAAMDEGKLVLVNLSPQQMSRKSQRMLGVMLVDLITQAAYSRADIPDEDKRRPFYFIIDEFADFVSLDIARGLERLRKFGCFFILSHQEQQQLLDESRRLYSAVMGNAHVKAIFTTDYGDAEGMAKQLFAKRLSEDVIKHETQQLTLIPIKTRETTYAKSHVVSDGSSGSQTESRDMGPMFFSGFAGLTHADTTGYTSGVADGSVEADVPWYDYEEFWQTIPQYRTPEELLQKFISWIMAEEPRRFQFKFHRFGPVPLISPYVGDVRVREKDIDAAIQRSREQYAKDVTQVNQQISERRAEFLSPSATKALPEPDEITTANWFEVVDESVPKVIAPENPQPVRKKQKRKKGE